MKKLLLFLAMLIPMAASAYDFMVDGVAYNILSAADLTCVVTEGCVPDNGKLVIPATVNYKNRTLTVVGIGDGKGVADFQTITDLTIENGPTYIEGSAFVFQRIQKLWIPPSIKLIKSDGFGSNMGHYNSIGNWISEPFEVIIEDGEDALKGEQPTFFPYPFNKGIVTRLYLGRSIDDKLFHGLGSLEDLTIGDMVTSVLREGVSMSFYMSSLKKLTVGKKLEIVPNLQETSLDEIYMRSETPPLSEGFKDGTYVSATLYVPRGTKEVYENAPTWQNFWTIEEYDVKDNKPVIVKSGYAILDSKKNTLTFKYGEKPTGDNIYDTEDTDYDYNKPAPWVSESLKSVVFEKSYSEARPKSTAYWFKNAVYLTSITGIEYLNTSEVTNMNSMFSSCINLKQLDLSHFNTEKVWGMNSLFSQCLSITDFDLSSFNTSNVIDFAYMFNNCVNLVTPGVGSFNTDNAVSMISMFKGCEKLSQVDLRSFNTEKVERIENMFDGCTVLKTIYVGGKWSTVKVTNGVDMFKDCTNLVGSAGTTYDSEHVDYTYAHIDGGEANPGYLSEYDERTDYAIFDSETGTLTFKYGVKPEGENVYPTIYDMAEYKKIYGDGFISPWHPIYKELKTVIFDESYSIVRPKSLYSWFIGALHLNEINGLEYLNTSEVENMSNLFGDCSSLTELDLSHFNTGNVTDMSGMFSECSSLKTIYVGDQWSTASITNGKNMFYGCTSLVGGSGTIYDNGHTDHTYAHIDGGTENPGYFSKRASMGFDINNDSKLDVKDIVDLIDFIAGKSPKDVTKDSADVNGDGKVDIADVIMVASATLSK